VSAPGDDEAVRAAWAEYEKPFREWLASLTSPAPGDEAATRLRHLLDYHATFSGPDARDEVVSELDRLVAELATCREAAATAEAERKQLLGERDDAHEVLRKTWTRAEAAEARAERAEQQNEMLALVGDGLAAMASVFVSPWTPKLSQALQEWDSLRVDEAAPERDALQHALRDLLSEETP